MTRETKVGLLVGMGIILLIGIIVSDHLSVAQQQTAADFTHFADQTQRSLSPQRNLKPIPMPRTVQRQTNNTQRNKYQSVASNKPRPRYQPTPTRTSRYQRPINTLTKQPQRVASATTQNDATPPTLTQTHRKQTIITSRPPTQTKKRAPQPIIHYVKTGESLWQIAQRYYNDGEHWRTIAKHNPKAIQPNGNVRHGVRLVIPNKDTLAITTTLAQIPTPQTTTKARSITVRSGDTLSSLAQRHLDSSGQWRRLYEANRDKLSQPHNLTTGMTLRIPQNSLPTASITHDAPTHRNTPSQRYTVKSNDSLSSIAASQLGNASRWDDIYQANRSILVNPDSLRVGQNLIIPAR